MHYSSPIIWAAALSWRLGTIHTSPEIFVPGVTEVCPKMLIRHVYGGPEHGPLHTLLLPLPGPLALYSIGLYFHHQSHPQLGVVFALAPSLQSFWSYFSTDLQEHIGHLLTWGVHLSMSYPVHHQLPEFTETHVHQVSDAIQRSHPLLSPSPPALNLSQHKGLFQ